MVVFKLRIPPTSITLANITVAFAIIGNTSSIGLFILLPPPPGHIFIVQQQATFCVVES